MSSLCLKGHFKNQCSELVGYLDNWYKTRDPRYNKLCTTIVETKEDSEHIAKKVFALLTNLGNDDKALNVSAFVTNNT